MRYSIMKVTTSTIVCLNEEEMQEHNNTGFIVANDTDTQICVVDHLERVAISIYEPHERFPMLGVSDGEFTLREEPIEKDKRYAIEFEELDIAFGDKKKIINRMKNKGVIPGKLVLYNVQTGITGKFDETGIVYNGKSVHAGEVTDLQKHLCTVNQDRTEAIDVATNESFRILKRDEFNHIIDDYKLGEDERHVITMEQVPTQNKVKMLSLQHKYKKDKKKSNF